MTTQGNQGAMSFTRSRRLTVAFALSVGAGSLVYGTVLAFPANADTASAAPSPTCSSTATATATPTKSATGTGTPTATTTDSSAPTATPTPTGSGTGSPTSSPTSTTTGGTPTPSTPDCATGTPTATTSATGTATPTKTHTATASPSPSKTITKAPTTAPAKGGPTSIPSAGGFPSIPVNTYSSGSGYYPYTDVPPGNAAYQWPHGSISRAQIIARAELWVQAQVPYSQTSWYTNANGTYRQDCSGYVSMAWDLDQNTDFWTGNLNLVSYTIPSAELLPGDILLSVKHTILFAGWADAAHTQFNYYEEAHPGTVARYVEDAPLAAFLDNGFAPFRYDGVQDSGAPLPANPASGQLYATLAKLASEINPPGVSALPPLGLDGSGPASESASGGPTTTQLSAQIAADDIVSSEGIHSEGMVLGVSGAVLVGLGLLLRRPFSLHGYRRKH